MISRFFAVGYRVVPPATNRQKMRGPDARAGVCMCVYVCICVRADWAGHGGDGALAVQGRVLLPNHHPKGVRMLMT